MKGECVAKGRKAGSGGKVFIHLDCKSMSQNSTNSTVFLFVQDRDPSQKLKIANMEVAKHGIKKISIPARSPDLNPIQNS